MTVNGKIKRFSHSQIIIPSLTACSPSSLFSSLMDEGLERLMMTKYYEKHPSQLLSREEAPALLPQKPKLWKGNLSTFTSVGILCKWAL